MSFFFDTKSLVTHFKSHLPLLQQQRTVSSFSTICETLQVEVIFASTCLELKIHTLQDIDNVLHIKEYRNRIIVTNYKQCYYHL